MALVGKLLKIQYKSQLSIKQLHCSSSLLHFNDNHWKFRYHRQLIPNPNRNPQFLHLPDYSFKDKSRPVPYGAGQKRRIDQQAEKYKTIIEYSKYLDNVILKYNMQQQEIEAKKQAILDSKLQKKGKMYLSNSSQGRQALES